MSQPPSCREMFLVFLQIGCGAFGGAQAWARHVIVERRQWLSEREYAEMLGLAQVLPGPNIGNLAVMLGRRWHGLAGAAAGLSGFFGLPLVIMAALASLYAGLGDVPAVRAAMQGVAAAAAGIVLGGGLRMAVRLRPPPEAIAIALLVALASAGLRAPLWLVALLSVPAGVAASLWRAKRGAR